MLQLVGTPSGKYSRLEACGSTQGLMPDAVPCKQENWYRWILCMCYMPRLVAESSWAEHCVYRNGQL
jgi:hypothetical protein